MKQRDKKLTVLRFLSQESLPISLSELLKKLDQDFKERTVRRWLDEMIQEGLVKKIGEGRATKYCIVQKILPTEKQTSSCFSSESLKAITYVRKPLYERSPVSYNTSWLDSYQPNRSFYLSQELKNQLSKAGARANNKDPAGTYAHRIFNRLLIDLSYNSSRLEGNTYSLLDTERLILFGTGAEGKLDEEKVMILNHKEAIRYLVENAPRLQVTKETICTIHYLLADALVEPQYAGKIRDHWVRISGSTYVPYEEPKKLTIQIEKILNKTQSIKDPFEQSFFLLVHLSYLQAFSDVNKRTARLSANIPLIVNNLVPLSFNDVERDDYISAMIAIYELQDTRPMIDLFVFSYMRTCAAYDSTIRAIGFDEIRVRYRTQRRALIRQIICQNLTGLPMHAFIKAASKSDIPKHDEEAFIEDVLEDLDQIDQNRIGGLGITVEQFQIWKEAYRKES